MTEQLVSFEVAELAKEKKLPVFLNIENNITGYNLSWKNKTPTYYHVHFSYPKDDEFLYAPTQSLLQKWLREKHNMYVIILFDGILFDISIYGKYADPEIKILSYLTTGPTYYTYEEALEQGLKEALKLIK